MFYLSYRKHCLYNDLKSMLMVSGVSIFNKYLSLKVINWSNVISQKPHKEAMRDCCDSNGYPGVFNSIEDIRCYTKGLKCQTEKSL